MPGILQKETGITANRFPADPDFYMDVYIACY
jgi:hypothetical protein